MTRRKQRRLRIASNAYRRELQRVIGRAERVPPKPKRRGRTVAAHIDECLRIVNRLAAKP